MDRTVFESLAHSEVSYMETEKSLMVRLFGARMLPMWLAVLLLAGCDNSSGQTKAERSAPPPPEAGTSILHR